MRNKIVLDTETGGFNERKNPLLSVSLIRLLPDLSPGETKTIYILPRPGTVISEEAAKINGYTPEKWAERGAVPLVNAMKDMFDWVGSESTAVAHNAKFDKRFVDYNFNEARVPSCFHPRWLCTFEASKKFTASRQIKVDSHGLDSMVQLTGLYKVGHVREIHEADEDALMCARLYKYMYDDVFRGEIDG